MNDLFRLEFHPDGTLRLLGCDDWKEPTCPVCGTPIRWVLDMFSFTQREGEAHRLAHARCVWTREGFTQQRRQALP